MTTLMPTALDTFVNPAGTDLLTGPGSVPHNSQHDNLNDAMLAVEQVLVGPALYNARGYGAKGDSADASDVTTTSGSGTISSATATWKVGQKVAVAGAAAAGAVLVDTIATVSGANATLTTLTASASLTNAYAQYGTDDTSAIQAAINAANTAGGGIVVLPWGLYTISASLSMPGSNIRLTGVGMGATVVRVLGGTTLSAGGMLYPTDAWNQVKCHISHITFDCNGQMCPAFTAATAYISLSSYSTMEQCEVVNRQGCSNALVNLGIWCVISQAHDVLIDTCYVHDDVWYQTTATPGVAGSAKTVTPASITGAQANGMVVIDPSVNAFADLSGAAGARTVTPRVIRENPYSNGGIAVPMLGIVSGMSLVIDTATADKILTATVTTPGQYQFPGTYFNVPLVAAGGSGALATVTITAGTPNTVTSVVVTNPGKNYTAAPTAFTATPAMGTVTAAATLGGTFGSAQETLAVSAPTTTTFALTTTKPHGTSCPITYTGATETAQITSVNTGAGTFVTTTQVAHSASVALLYRPSTGDAIAFGNLSPTQLSQGIKVHRSRFFGTAIDAIGTSSGNEIEVWGNVIAMCCSGITTTDQNSASIKHNHVDLSWAGLCPNGASYAGYFFVALQAGPLTWTDHNVSNNRFIGGSWGVNVSPGSQVVLQNLVIADNEFEAIGISAILTSSHSGFTYSGNNVHNCNQFNLAAQPTTGGTVGAIVCIGASANQVVKQGVIGPNVITDTRGTHQMGRGVVLWGANVSAANDVLVESNVITGFVTKGVVQTSALGITRNNPGYNPQGGLITTPSLPTSTTHIQNTTGCDVMVSLTAGTVTAVIVYDTANANAATMAVATGCNVFLPAYAYLSITYSVAPTMKWYGV